MPCTVAKSRHKAWDSNSRLTTGGDALVSTRSTARGRITAAAAARRPRRFAAAGTRTLTLGGRMAKAETACCRFHTEYAWIPGEDAVFSFIVSPPRGRSHAASQLDVLHPKTRHPRFRSTPSKSNTKIRHLSACLTSLAHQRSRDRICALETRPTQGFQRLDPRPARVACARGLASPFVIGRSISRSAALGTGKRAATALGQEPCVTGVLLRTHELRRL